MMNHPLVAETVLDKTNAPICDFVQGMQQPFAINCRDPDYGRAFVYYLFFYHHPSIIDIIDIDIPVDAQFYNAYYWFQRFSRIYMNKHGYDAGLEQQAFEMLENAGTKLDFEIIEMIDNKANE